MVNLDRNLIIVLLVLVVVTLFIIRPGTIVINEQTMYYQETGQYADRWTALIFTDVVNDRVSYSFRPENTETTDPKRILQLDIQPLPGTCSYGRNPYTPPNPITVLTQLFGSGTFSQLTGGDLDKKVNFSALTYHESLFGSYESLGSRLVDATDLNSGAEVSFSDNDADGGSLAIKAQGTLGGSFDCPETQDIMLWRYTDTGGNIRDRIVDQSDFEQHLGNIVLCAATNTINTFCANDMAYFNNPPLPNSWLIPGGSSRLTGLTASATTIRGNLAGDITGSFIVYADAELFDSVFVTSFEPSRPDLTSCSSLTLDENSQGSINVNLANGLGAGSTPITVRGESTDLSIGQSITTTLQPGQSTSLSFSIVTPEIDDASTQETKSITFIASTASGDQIREDSLICNVVVAQAPEGMLGLPPPILEPTQVIGAEGQPTEAPHLPPTALVCAYPLVQSSTSTQQGGFLGLFPTTTVTEQCVLDPNLITVALIVIGGLILYTIFGKKLKMR